MKKIIKLPFYSVASQEPTEGDLAHFAFSVIGENGADVVKFYRHFGTEHTAIVFAYENAICVKCLNSGNIYQF